jgi:hypothetical protein
VSSESQIGGASKPTNVSGADVGVDFEGGKLLEGADNARLVRRLDTGVLGTAKMGDQGTRLDGGRGHGRGILCNGSLNINTRNQRSQDLPPEIGNRSDNPIDVILVLKIPLLAVVGSPLEAKMVRYVSTVGTLATTSNQVGVGAR